MMEERRAAAVLAACNWLKKQISVIESDAKSHIRLKGGESKNAELPVGDETITVGKVIMANGKKSVSVEDWPKLTEWLEEHLPKFPIGWYPDPQAWAKMTADIAKAGALYDAEGEVCPYVVVLQGDPYSMTKLDTDVADEVFGKLIRSKVMSVLFDGTPQLSIETKDEGTQGE